MVLSLSLSVDFFENFPYEREREREIFLRILTIVISLSLSLTHSLSAQVKRKEREIRVLVVGLDNAGKTTIVKRINGEDISKISPTLGFNISSLHLNEYRLNVWDVGGQKTLRTFWRNYFEKTDALVWVVDLSLIHI